MLRFAAANVATPFTAVTGPPPDSVPPPGLAPIATLMLPAKPVATLLFTSSAVTVTAGLIATPATALLGCWLNTSCVAPAGVMLKAPDVAPATDGAVAASV